MMITSVIGSLKHTNGQPDVDLQLIIPETAFAIWKN